MKHRVSAFLVLSGCIFSLLSGCTLLSRQDSSGPQTPDLTSPAPPKPEQPSVNPPKCELPIPRQRTIDAAVAGFSDVHHRGFQIELDRACNYVQPAKKIFRKTGLPPDLVYVALVESGFIPKARSRANAVGMWQIIPQTGARLGLLKNRWIDERCNPMKAAQAAADYLSHLYDIFGDWPLALAAYNAGQRTVREALDRSGLKTFWELAEAGRLPAETRAYVPRVFAAVIIARAPGRYGFWYRPDHYVARYEKVSVPGGVKLAWVGKQIGVPKTELLNCNPELCKPVTPPCCSEYKLCVPLGCRDGVLAALASRQPCEAKPEKEFARSSGSFYKTLAQAPAVYRIARADTRVNRARRYKRTATARAGKKHTGSSRRLMAERLAAVPALSAHGRVKSGRSRQHSATRVLLAHNRKQTPAKRIDWKPKKAVVAKRVCYMVGHGDTLWTISRRFHVPVRTLCAQNDLRPNQKITPGARLAIHTSPKGRLFKR
ncbi:MAG: transglycosylase SLT domain-containing protein [Syntrophobacteraceae bacterium]|nr:transglycosylase SLT domain-containing protein [Syntrophobacteraceae bacterium]